MESTFSTAKYFPPFTWIQQQDIHVSQCTQTQPQLAKIKPVSRKLMVQNSVRLSPSFKVTILHKIKTNGGCRMTSFSICILNIAVSL